MQASMTAARVTPPPGCASEEIAVECRGVWKIFGAGAVEAVAAAKRENLDKAAVADRFQSILSVADASFAVRRGEIFCVMGLSGSGKSTLVRHINRLIEPTAGEILVNGARVDLMGSAELLKLRCQTIAMVFQHVALLPHRTVRDNVAFGLEIRGLGKAPRREIAEHKLELVQLAGWGDRYPDELSGGMQQRVGLARALAADPDILLMDEPFSALDPLIRRELQDQFLELSRSVGKTTVFITHDLEEAIKLGNHIGIMRDGRIIQIGTPEEIVGRPADDYVADFVRGVSRLKLLRAEHIMQPLSGEAIAAGQARARPETGLETLIDLMIRTPGGIAIETEAAKPVGMITLEGLLRAIRGTSPTP
jgi:glycine betaine/proline transport system ATP-binding protein